MLIGGPTDVNNFHHSDAQIDSRSVNPDHKYSSEELDAKKVTPLTETRVAVIQQR
jgi:hypothetical protein